MQDSILNVTVSAFRNYNTPNGPQPVNLLQWLTSAKYATKVAAIRNEADKAARDAKKAALPAITPSGQFAHRNESGLISHSGFIGFDIDPKENQHIRNYGDLKAQIRNIVNVAYCGLSVSGTGYWGLIPVAHPERHKEHFTFIQQAFAAEGINIDPAPKSISSLRGYSYDADAYFSHQATTLTQYHKPPPTTLKSPLYNTEGNNVQAQVESRINQIKQTGIDIAPNYGQWLEVGFGFASEFGSAGRSYFHDVSSCHPRYNEREADEQYTKCLNSGGRGITIKTFFHLCKVAGIVIPEKYYPASQPTKKPASAWVASTADEPKPFAAPAAPREQLPTVVAEPVQRTKPDPLRQPPPENWIDEIEDLQAFFNSLPLSTQPVRLDACTTITNVTAFTGGHLAAVISNNGKPAYRPYLDRLQALKHHFLK